MSESCDIKNKALLVFLLQWGRCDRRKFVNIASTPNQRSALLRTHLQLKMIIFTWQISTKSTLFFSSFVLFRAHSFWNTHLRKYLPPLDSVRLSEVRSYSLDNIFNFTFSFPKVPWLVNAVAEIWLHRNLLLVLLYYLTTPQLQTTGRPTKRCLNVSTTTWSENLLWSLLLLIWCFDNIRCTRRSSGTVHLVVSVQSDWDYLRVFFSDWPFWASTQESILYYSDSKEVKSVSRNKVVFISLSISLKILW